MTSPANMARARRSLLELRGKFEVEARRHPDFYNVLLCASSFDDQKTQESPPVPRLDEKAVFKRPWCPGLNDGMLIFYYYGDASEAERFGELALQASRVWASVSSVFPESERFTAKVGFQVEWEYESILPQFESLRDRLDVPLWLLVVHALSWRQFPGSGLVGSRKIWDRTWPIMGHFPLPFEQRQREDVLRACPRELRDRLESDPLPSYYYSELPRNVFECSVEAISLILELDFLESDALLESPRSRTAGGPAILDTSLSNHVEKMPLDDNGSELGGSIHGSDVARPDVGRKRSKSKSPVSKSIANEEVRKALVGKDTVSARRISKITGLSLSSIHNTHAWKSHMSSRPEKSSPKIRQRSLKHDSLDRFGGHDNPSVWAEFFDIMERGLLALAKKDHIADYRSMEDTKRLSGN